MTLDNFLCMLHGDMGVYCVNVGVYFLECSKGLVTRYREGGYKTGVKVYPYEKGGGRKKF